MDGREDKTDELKEVRRQVIADAAGYLRELALRLPQEDRLYRSLMEFVAEIEQALLETRG